MSFKLSPFSTKLAKMLKRHEGIKPTVDGWFEAYEDEDGITIAGHLLRDTSLVRALKICGGECMLLTQEAIEGLLYFDIGEAIQIATRIFPNWKGLSEARQLALANFCYNLGYNRVMKFVEMIKAVASGDFQRAANEIRYVNGLTRSKPSAYAIKVGKRCEEIATILETGVYDDKEDAV